MGLPFSKGRPFCYNIVGDGMDYLFICYKGCSTCAKARKYLKDNNIGFEEREITEDTPTENEIKTYLKQSDYQLKDFFNTRGGVYRKLNLKQDYNKYSEAELIKMLSEDGMLMKRPILVSKDKLILGFNEKAYSGL